MYTPLIIAHTGHQWKLLVPQVAVPAERLDELATEQPLGSFRGVPPGARQRARQQRRAESRAGPEASDDVAPDPETALSSSAGLHRPDFPTSSMVGFKACASVSGGSEHQASNDVLPSTSHTCEQVLTAVWLGRLG